jgi:hypothetical protein
MRPGFSQIDSNYDRIEPQLLTQDTDDLLLVGWREWIALPEFGVDRLHAKLDSGATMSSLHAERIEEFKRKSQSWVRFFLIGDHDRQETPYHCNARLLEYRSIRSSNGFTESRPVIETTLYIAGFQWPIEVTLTNRETLECRMLVGRSALAGRCLVDCGRSDILTK